MGIALRRRIAVLVVGLAVALVVSIAVGVVLPPARSAGATTAFYFVDNDENMSGMSFFGGTALEIAGSGTFAASGVAARGTFSIYTPASSTGPFTPGPPSTVNAFGAWTATSVMSFKSYGFAGSAEGGLLVLSITMTFASGTVLSGVTLTVSCRVNAPAGAPDEGVTVIGSGIAFDMSVPGRAGGLTVFTTGPSA